jgi:hypothetical protein
MKFKKALSLLNPLLLCLSSAISSLAIDVKTDFPVRPISADTNLRLAERRNTESIVD